MDKELVMTTTSLIYKIYLQGFWPEQWFLWTLQWEDFVSAVYYYPSFGGGRGAMAERGPAIADAAPPRGAVAAAPDMSRDGSSKDGGSTVTGQLKEVSRIRSEFPETWLWQESSTG